MPTVMQGNPVATLSSTRAFPVCRLGGDRVRAIATTANKRRARRVSISIADPDATTLMSRRADRPPQEDRR
jgi:hypothetical protein